MRTITRRMALSGALAVGASLASTLAQASLAPALADHPGYSAWDKSHVGNAIPLSNLAETTGAARSLRDWIGPRPAVLALWATWCGPCLMEKPAQAHMNARLLTAGARARIFALQAYDNVTLSSARRVLARLNASELPNARASEEAEKAFVDVFGASPRAADRVSMPSVLLLDADGRELGRAVGTMPGADGLTDYWDDDETFEFLRQL